MKQHESFYWWSQRLFSITLIPLTISVFFVIISLLSSNSFSTVSVISSLFKNGYFYLFLVTGVITSLHIRLGMEEIIEDYIHDEKVKLISSICLRILAIQMIHDLYSYLCSISVYAVIS